MRHPVSTPGCVEQASGGAPIRRWTRKERPWEVEASGLRLPLAGWERTMTKSKFRGEQIVHALRQADGGTAFGAVCRQFGASQATSRVWTKKTGQLGLNEREE